MTYISFFLSKYNRSIDLKEIILNEEEIVFVIGWSIAALPLTSFPPSRE